MGRNLINYQSFWMEISELRVGLIAPHVDGLGSAGRWLEGIDPAEKAAKALPRARPTLWWAFKHLNACLLLCKAAVHRALTCSTG